MHEYVINILSLSMIKGQGCKVEKVKTTLENSNIFPLLKIPEQPINKGIEGNLHKAFCFGKLLKNMIQ